MAVVLAEQAQPSSTAPKLFERAPERRHVGAALVRLRLPTFTSISDLQVSLFAFGIYLSIALLATWPLALHFSTRIGGDGTDPWQTFWGFWWWRYSTDFGENPMRTTMLWWPHGASLWLQTFDIPSALLVWPLWHRVPDPVLYNLPLLFSFPASGLTFYWLCRELHAGRLAAGLAGGIYTFAPYHFAHANACLHVASMQWTPLFLLGFHRIVTRPTKSAAVIAGAAFALATLTSAYHFAFCLVTASILVVYHRLASKAADFAKPTGVLKAALGAGAVALMLAGWLMWGIWMSYTSGAYIGAHPPARFSADAESFFLPNAISVWSRYAPFWKHWTATHWMGATGLWASAAYIGYVALALASVAWWRGEAREWLVVAIAGAVVAIGPQLQVGGVSYAGRMPYAWISESVPALAFSGIPSRFAWLTICGVAVAAGATLARICMSGRRGRIIAVSLTTLALFEYWPHTMLTSSYPRLSILARWAQDSDRWAVLDTTWWSRALWHQTLHRHPIIGGYLTRPPERGWSDLEGDPDLEPLVGHLFGKTAAGSPLPSRVVARLRELDVRYVIVDDNRADVPLRLGLRESFHGDGVRIFEVPRYQPRSRHGARTASR